MATFVLGERREEAHSEQEEGQAMLREDLRLPDVSGYVKEAQSHRAIAADGLRQTRKAVRRRRPIEQSRRRTNKCQQPPRPINGAERVQKRALSKPRRRPCAKLPIDARSAKAERLIGTAQLRRPKPRKTRGPTRTRPRDSCEPTSCEGMRGRRDVRRRPG